MTEKKSSKNLSKTSKIVNKLTTTIQNLHYVKVITTCYNVKPGVKSSSKNFSTFKKYLNPSLKSQLISPSNKSSMLKMVTLQGFETKKSKASSKPK